MRIRLAGIEELRQVQQVEDACFQEERYEPEVLQAMLAEEDFYTFVADDEEEVLGSATLLHRSGNPLAQLVSIGVVPAHRGRGVAKALLRQAEGHARREGAKRMTLQVNVLNVAAINLYLHLGYAIQGVIGDYYGPGKDAYFMDKPL
jgi:ribosomal-protein-alanine N-acetyltransferase